ncbi:MAG TPA: hypothetical protein PK156_30750 [Polyangium sp.]|nr:hypothetical protein [Polyangium sp.]
MQALKLHITVDEAVVQLIPGLTAMLGQRVELIALSPSQEVKHIRRLPVPGVLAGQIILKDDFDAPLPDDIRHAFEGDEP